MPKSWLDELEGVGPKTREKLEAFGITSYEHLSMFTVDELVEAGIEYERAVKILQQARQRAQVVQVAKASELKKTQVRVFKTGLAEFDEKTPWRGVREGFIYEFAGEFGTGKSMFAHQLSAAAISSGFTQAVVYIDTEGTFSTSLLEAAAKRFGADPQKVLDVVYVVMPVNVSYLEEFVKYHLPRHVKESARLLVVDTITALYRAEFVGREHLAERQQRIHYLLDWLRRHARVYGVTSVLTNQVMDVPEVFAAGVKRPAGGNVLAHAVNARFLLVRPNKQKPEGYMWPLDVPGMPPEERINYRITDGGLE